ncbi:GNAT family N-acetyltransferase [Shouchella lehensis]|uniref:N-acetyltransferase n=1 Tax=Shouchella lehensis G1 TaxID=1246626 RepID=A0A060LYS7_9BACI|nr:GNAT family protein [Shouchella lehensis]AIC92954.1 N-acetyltransferase [Shouchella lehensis G1]
MKTIYSERLSLQEVSQKDAESLFHIWSNPEITKFMNIPAMTNVNQAMEMIQLFESLSREKKGNRFTISLTETNTVIGSCGFNYLDYENDRGEIGYELDKDYWGLGYMTEALKALVHTGFSQFDLNRIEAKVEPQNVASQAVLKKIGFKEEGLLRKYEKAKGTYIDLIMFSILKEDL